MAVHKDEVIALVVMSAISIFIFLVGFYGGKAIWQGDVLTTDRERVELNTKQSILTREIFERARYWDGSSRFNATAVDELRDKRKKLEREFRLIPNSESRANDRLKLSAEISKIESQLQKEKEIFRERYFAGVPQSKWSKSAQKFQLNQSRLNEINALGDKYSKKNVIFHKILSVLCTLMLSIGIIMIFMFVICGSITLLGSLE